MRSRQWPRSSSGIAIGNLANTSTVKVHKKTILKKLTHCMFHPVRGRPPPNPQPQIDIDQTNWPLLHFLHGKLFQENALY